MPLLTPHVPTPLNLALQGGGAHGALTWGVLDALLAAHPRLQIQALSGASAGAMNAVALVQGWMDGGPEGAREALSRFWLTVADSVPPEASRIGPDGAASLAPMVKLLMQWTHHFTPAQTNPLDRNPLRDIVLAQFDFERLRASTGPALHLAVTDALTGRLTLVRRPALSADALLASACLPSLYRPVMLDGRPGWDGGFAANPPVLPLVSDSPARDTLLVLLAPLALDELPETAAQIQQRCADIGFNAGFLREMQLLAAWRAQARQAWLPLGQLTRRLAHSRFHLIDGGARLATLGDDSRLVVHRDFLLQLRDIGRELAQAWIADLRPGAPGLDLAATFG